MHGAATFSPPRIARRPRSSDLRVVMDAAHRATDIPGGATFVMAQLVAPSGGDADASATLQGLNLGDSAFMVFRNGRRVFESPTQSHGFNMPYQFTQVSSEQPLPHSIVLTY